MLTTKGIDGVWYKVTDVFTTAATVRCVKSVRRYIAGKGVLLAERVWNTVNDKEAGKKAQQYKMSPINRRLPLAPPNPRSRSRVPASRLV